LVESKEAKGFLINLGTKDQTKGFLAFCKETQNLQTGQIVFVVLKNNGDKAKIVKCDLLNKQNA